MVITGDRSQIDLPNGVRSWSFDAESLLANIPKSGSTILHSKDVVRHPLVATIIEAYDNRSQQ